MKQLYTTLIFSLLVSVSFANPVISVRNNNGQWKNASTWDLNRLPKNGDTVLIQAGVTLTIDDNINLGSDNIYVKIGGVLILDGGQLNMASGSSIVLLNGGKIFSNGNNSEQIRIGSTLKYKGSEGVITGSSIADATTGASPNGFSSLGTLPVVFAGFNLARQNTAILVDWSTATESNSQYFEIQRSYDGSNWMTITTVNAAGNSAAVKTYSYTDRTATGTVIYYRIRQVDLDGRSVLTAVRTIKLTEADAKVKIASGGNNNLYLHFADQVKGAVSVKLISMNGQVVSSSTLTNPVGQQLLPVNVTLKGMYMVAVTDGNGLKQAAQVLL